MIYIQYEKKKKNTPQIKYVLIRDFFISYTMICGVSINLPLFSLKQFIEY